MASFLPMPSKSALDPDLPCPALTSGDLDRMIAQHQRINKAWISLLHLIDDLAKEDPRPGSPLEIIAAA